MATEASENTSGAVGRGTVIDVLKAAASESGYSISVSDEGDAITIIKDSVPEVIILTPQVPRRMLGRFAGKYGVRIEYFYHPEMCCAGNATRH